MNAERFIITVELRGTNTFGTLRLMLRSMLRRWGVKCLSIAPAGSVCPKVAGGVLADASPAAEGNDSQQGDLPRNCGGTVEACDA